MQPHPPPLSVVVVSHNEGENLRRTVEHLLQRLPAESELIVVDDFSTDGSAEVLQTCSSVRLLKSPVRLGVARARNFGAEVTQGDVILFSDAHVEVEAGCMERLLVALSDRRVGMVGPGVTDLHERTRRGYGRVCTELLESRWLTWRLAEPYPVPLLCGMFLMLRKEVFGELRGFDPGMEQWGHEDLELSLRLWTLGYQCVVVPRAEIAHLFRDRSPYQVDAMHVTRNQLRVGMVHLTEPRLSRFLKVMENRSGFVEALNSLDDVPARRQEVHTRRRFDDSWYFEHMCSWFN